VSWLKQEIIKPVSWMAASSHTQTKTWRYWTVMQLSREWGEIRYLFNDRCDGTFEQAEDNRGGKNNSCRWRMLWKQGGGLKKHQDVRVCMNLLVCCTYMTWINSLFVVIFAADSVDKKNSPDVFSVEFYLVGLLFSPIFPAHLSWLFSTINSTFQSLSDVISVCVRMGVAVSLKSRRGEIDSPFYASCHFRCRTYCIKTHEHVVWHKKIHNQNTHFPHPTNTHHARFDQIITTSHASRPDE